MSVEARFEPAVIESKYSEARAPRKIYGRYETRPRSRRAPSRYLVGDYVIWMNFPSSVQCQDDQVHRVVEVCALSVQQSALAEYHDGVCCGQNTMADIPQGAQAAFRLCTIEAILNSQAETCFVLTVNPSFKRTCRPMTLWKNRGKKCNTDRESGAPSDDNLPATPNGAGYDQP